LNALLKEKITRIKLLVSDIDGVWTDGTITLNADGTESVSFSVLDGFGLMSLMRKGIEVAIISGRDTVAVSSRAKRLGVKKVYLGKLNKGEIISKIIKESGLKKEEVASIGDDLPDLEMFAHSELRFAPKTAVPAVLDAADYVCQLPAGKGALREVCDLLIKDKA